MATRLELQTLLESLAGVSKVYFQPPEDVRLEYPCIVYVKSKVDSRYADNLPYNTHNGYNIQVLDSNPDSLIPSLVAQLPSAKFVTRYRKNNLYHDVYSIYF
jgi:hypothetical protein